jgi:hypothetical protein
MTTQFRSKGKGKDRKVYPLKKRNPYGINRELAAKDVQALRNEGKKARLIKTNKRLDLYAPYVSDLPSQSTSPSPSNDISHTQAPQQQAVSIPTNSNMTVNPQKNRMILESLGILNEKGKVNELKKNMRLLMGGADCLITVVDGKTQFLFIDASRVAMIQERLVTTLPDGEYTMKMGDDGIPHISPLDADDTRLSRLKAPMLDYGMDTAVLSIPRVNLREFISTLSSGSKTSDVFFFESKDGKKGMDIMIKGEDKDGSTTKNLIYHYDGQVPDDVRCALPSEYVISTIQAMLGRQRTTKPDVSDFLMKIKSDYPAEIEFTGNDVRGEPVGYRALIAPRME